MSAPAKKASAYVPTLADEHSFRRRRNHAQIEAMTGLILQAVGYPTRRHRDFICALQSVNSGNDARVPYTPFRRAHLTLADLMKCDGSPETRRKAVYREIATLRRFQRRTGIVLFHVTPGSEEEATEYIDYLTPAADSAVQRMLSSGLWKTDKAAAKREAVEWAVSQLPRCDVEEEPEAGSSEASPAELLEEFERRLESWVEKKGQEFERRGGDLGLLRKGLVRAVSRVLESLEKTAPARLDYSGLSSTGAEGVTTTVAARGEDTTVLSGYITGDRTVPPRGDSSVLPPLGNQSKIDVLTFQEPTLFSADAGADAAGPANLEAALSYARLGWPVFPLHHPDPHRGCSCPDALECRSPGKHPRTRKGLNDATTDEAQIRHWWGRYPLANVGLAMGRRSGLVAVDVDPRSGGDVSISELIERHGALPETLEAVTGGGGSHILFAYPGPSFKNSSSVLGEGLDVKTDGGYIVAAPSLHASGRRYEWRTRSRPARMPAWLLDLLTAEKSLAPTKATAARRAPQPPTSGPAIPHHSRNVRLFRLACALRGNGADYSEIEAAVFEAYEQRCEKGSDPMSPDELRKIARSAARYPAGK